MSARTWTIRDVLDWATQDFSARGIESARLDAELLVARALGIDRIGLYLDLHRPLQEAERSAIRPLVARRRDREPVAYILGHRDFFGRRFEVTPDVLIPRPDTETLVEHALAQIPKDAPSRVLDVGTGSGAIAVTLASERPAARITATDISKAALEVAGRNAAAHGVQDRITFEHVDLLRASSPYDVIVSNPPYIARTEVETLQEEVRDHEPDTALFGGEDGLDVIRRLLDVARPAVEAGAHLLIEVGAAQAAAVVYLGIETGAWKRVAVYPDLDRVERVVHLRRT
ncbi:MAG: peptide chain release factor N(5)-glutamine methyltransferase [Polyangiales bacterium]